MPSDIDYKILICQADSEVDSQGGSHESDMMSSEITSIIHMVMDIHRFSSAEGVASKGANNPFSDKRSLLLHLEVC